MLANLNLSYLSQCAKIRNNTPQAEFKNYNLKTALQPIYSLAHKRIVGYEALLRVKDKKNTDISPSSLFSKNLNSKEIIHLDRLSRYIHIHNFSKIKDDLNWLFLNVSPETITRGKVYGSFFRELLEKYDFPANRIVIEVVEHPIGDNSRLLDIIEFYKDLGCLIAIDDFGAGHSNFDRIWTLKPDIVKLDRSFLTKASRETSVKNMLSGIVSLLHQSGAFVLMEGIETKEHALMAIESNTDFVQGYFFGRPTTELSPNMDTFSFFDSIFSDYKKMSDFEDLKLKKTLARYSSIFNKTINSLKLGHSLSKASQELVREPSVLRCYQMKSNGIQVGKTISANSICPKKDLKFRPLEDGRSADWFRRHYLKRAILHPHQLQITRPYLSITGAEMCITLSMMFARSSGEDNILCCDIST